eukprot:gene7222-11117_t
MFRPKSKEERLRIEEAIMRKLVKRYGMKGAKEGDIPAILHELQGAQEVRADGLKLLSLATRILAKVSPPDACCVLKRMFQKQPSSQPKATSNDTRVPNLPTPHNHPNSENGMPHTPPQQLRVLTAFYLFIFPRNVPGLPLVNGAQPCKKRPELFLSEHAYTNLLRLASQQSVAASEGLLQDMRDNRVHPLPIHHDFVLQAYGLHSPDDLGSYLLRRSSQNVYLTPASYAALIQSACLHAGSLSHVELLYRKAEDQDVATASVDTELMRYYAVHCHPDRAQLLYTAVVAHPTKKPPPQFFEQYRKATDKGTKPLPAGDTPLHSAVAARQVDVIRLLLERSADTLSKDSEGRTVLHLAVALGSSLEVVRMLASVLPDAGVNSCDDLGNTPLHTAAANGSCYDVVIHLLDAGANMRAVNMEGLTPLYLAVTNCCLPASEALEARGATADDACAA